MALRSDNTHQSDRKFESHRHHLDQFADWIDGHDSASGRRTGFRWEWCNDVGLSGLGPRDEPGPCGYHGSSQHGDIARIVQWRIAYTDDMAIDFRCWKSERDR